MQPSVAISFVTILGSFVQIAGINENKFDDDADEGDMKVFESSKMTGKLHQDGKDNYDAIKLDGSELLLQRIEELETKISELEYSRYHGKKIGNRANRYRKKLQRVDAFLQTEPAQYGGSQGSEFKSVAFTVQNAKDPVINIKDGDVIKYDEVLTTVGNEYEPKSGHFTAPVYGYYQFYVSVMCTEGKYVELLLKLNGKTLSSAYASGTRWKWYDVGSTMVVVFLKKGDEVWVEKCCGHDKLRGKGHSQFTGFLIRREPERLDMGPS